MFLGGLVAQELPEVSLSGKFLQGKPENIKVYLLAIEKPRDLFRGSVALVIDSSEIGENGVFVFPEFGELDSNLIYRLNFIESGENPGMINRNYPFNSYIFVINENVSVNIEIADYLQISKSYQLSNNVSLLPKNEFFQDMRNLELPIYEAAISVRPTGQDPSVPVPEDSVPRLRQMMMDALTSEIIPTYDKIIQNNTDIHKVSFAAIQMLDFKPIEENLSYYQEVLNRLGNTSAHTPFYQAWQTELARISSAPLIGQKMPNIRLSTLTADTTELYATKGKLILVDFWASWCMPCRKENRETIRPMYADLKKDGFEVFGVSFDKSKDAWEKAIRQDGLTWINVSDLEGTKDSPLYKSLELSRLPTSYLLDEKFQIIKINLRGEDLKSFVEDYLKE
ncbi:MAG: TlpA disulfide reductase family protein [Cyanobacteria bacterium J06649_11]